MLSMIPHSLEYPSLEYPTLEYPTPRARSRTDLTPVPALLRYGYSSPGIPALVPAQIQTSSWEENEPCAIPNQPLGLQLHHHPMARAAPSGIWPAPGGPGRYLTSAGPEMEPRPWPQPLVIHELPVTAGHCHPLQGGHGLPRKGLYRGQQVNSKPTAGAAQGFLFYFGHTPV